MLHGGGGGIFFLNSNIKLKGIGSRTGYKFIFTIWSNW